MEVKVSIIIPVYNAGEFLDTCLASVTNQTLQEIEIICIDDASTDDSYDILQRYACQDDRIILLHNDVNRGQSNARNRALKIAKGEYIQYVDADDFIELSTVQDNYEIAHENKLELLLTECVIHKSLTSEVEFGNKKELSPVCTGYEVCKYLSYKFCLATWAYFVNLKFLRKNNIKFKEGIVHEDVLIAYYMLKNAKRSMYYSKPNYHYLTYNSYTTGNPDKNRNYFSCLKVYSEITRERIRDEFTDRFLGMIVQRAIACRRNSRTFIDRSHWDKDVLDIENSIFGKNYINAKLISERADHYKHCESIYIYGAGNVASQLFEELNRYGVSIDGIVVTKRDKRYPTFFGYKLIEKKDLKSDKKTTQFLVSVAGKEGVSIAEDLKKEGYKNVDIVANDGI